MKIQKSVWNKRRKLQKHKKQNQKGIGMQETGVNGKQNVEIKI